MIVSRLRPALLLAAAALTGTAHAVGLGEITLHSRIGEPIRAELPIHAGEGDSLDVSCFSLAPLPGSDLPVVTGARLRLVRIGQNYRLIISGGKPVDEPAFAINIRAACGIDLLRDYVLLPAPPLQSATLPAAPEFEEAPPPRPVVRRKPRPPAAEPVAAAWPETPAQQPPTERQERPARAARPAAPPNPPPANPNRGDRLMLGSAPDAPRPAGAGNPLAELGAVEERMLRMETTLHLLDDELAKLDAALELKAEARAVQEKLKGLQASQPAAAPLPASPPEKPAEASSGSLDDWLQLLLGVLLGGAVSAAVAHLVTRHQAPPGRVFDAPPRISRPRKSHPAN